MDISHIGPLLDSVAKVGRDITSITPSRGELSVTQELFTQCPINIVSGISGDLEGIAMIGFSRESAFAFAEHELKRPIRVFDNAVSTVLINFGEQILEACSTSLKSTINQFSFTPAALIRGTGILIPTNGQPTLVVPLHFEKFGTIYVKLNVKAKLNEQAA